MMDPPNDIAYSRNLRDHRFQGRVLELEKQIILGSYARRLEQPHGEWSHQFRMYIKSMHGNGGHQVSEFVGKAVFRFVGSSAEYVEVVEREPFSISSYCNGRLQVIITLMFKARYQTCSIVHHVITVPDDNQLCSHHERMQTIIFVNPSRRMRQMLHLLPKRFDLTKDNPDPVEEAAHLQRELKRARKALKKHPIYLVNPPSDWTINRL